MLYSLYVGNLDNKATKVNGRYELYAKGVCVATNIYGDKNRWRGRELPCCETADSVFLSVMKFVKNTFRISCDDCIDNRSNR